MILFISKNSSVADIRHYKKTIAPIIKIKRSTILRQLNLQKKDLYVGDYYKIDTTELKNIFSKKHELWSEIPLNSKLESPILIKKGKYILKDTNLITSKFPYKYSLVKDKLSLEEDISLKQNLKVTSSLQTIQQIFELKPLKRQIYPAYFISAQKIVTDLKIVSDIFNQFNLIFLKEIVISNNKIMIEDKKLKILIASLAKKIGEIDTLAPEDKEFKRYIEELPLEELFKLFSTPSKSSAEVPEEKLEEPSKVVEEEEDLDFF